MESHGGNVRPDLSGSGVYTQPAFTNIGHHTTIGANVDVTERLCPAPGVDTAFGNAGSTLGFLWGSRHARAFSTSVTACTIL
jgi:hypothetical protein